MGRSVQLVMVFDRSTITVALAHRSPQSPLGMSIEALHSETITSDDSLAEFDGWVAVLQPTMAAAIANLGRSIPKECCIAIPGIPQLMRTVRAPVVDRSRQRDAITYEARNAIPVGFEDMLWSWKVLGNDGIDLTVLIMATRTALVSGVIDACIANRLRPLRVVPTPAIVWNAYRHLNDPDFDEPVVVVQPGQHSTHYFIWIPKKDLYGNSTSFGLDLGVDDFSKKLRGELGRALPKVIDVPDRTSEKRSFVELIPSAGIRVLVTADGYADQLIGALERDLQCTVSRLAFEHNSLPSATPETSPSHHRSLVIGSCIPIIREQSIEIDFSPLELVEKRSYRRRAPWIIAAAALFTLSPIIPLWQLDALNTSAKLHYNAAISEEARLQSIAEEIRMIDVAITDSIEKSASLARLALARTAWLGFLAHLHDSLQSVEDVWLDALVFERFHHSKTVSDSQNHAALDVTDSRNGAVIRVRGRMVDRENPLQRASLNTQRRVHRLLDQIEAAPGVAGISDKRFDTRQNGLLQFEFAITMNSALPL